MACPLGKHRSWPWGCECGVIPVVVSSLASSFVRSSSYDAGIAEVNRRYAAAVSGNPSNFVGGQSALESLLSGAGKDPAYPGGFADDRVEAYSYQKYQQAAAIIGGGSAAGITAITAGPPAGGGNSLTDTLAGFFSKVTAPSANTAAAAAGTAAAKQAQSTILTIGLLVAGALVVGALILRRR